MRQWSQARSMPPAAPSPKLGSHTLPPLPSHPFSTTHRMEAPPHRPPPLSHIATDSFDSGSKLPFELSKTKPLFGENGGRGLSSFDSPGEKPLFGDPSKSKPSLGVFEKDTNSFDLEAKNGSPFAERLPFDIKNTYSGFSGNKKGEFEMDSNQRDSDRFLPGSAFRPSSDFVHGLLADLDMMKQFYQTIKHEQSNLQNQMSRWNENIGNLKQQNGADPTITKLSQRKSFCFFCPSILMYFNPHRPRQTIIRANSRGSLSCKRCQ